jgi:hypothetical protein
MSRSLSILLLLISGCAMQPYWTLANAPLPVLHVVHVDFPCAGMRGADPTARGCWNANAQTIEIKRGLSAANEVCVLRHERAHAAGWTHPANMAYVADCGPKQ